jgi:hypothetical protein
MYEQTDKRDNTLTKNKIAVPHKVEGIRVKLVPSDDLHTIVEVWRRH